MSISFDEAKLLLANNPEDYATPEALRALANQLSVEADGAVTVLYSRDLGGSDFNAEEVVKSMIRQGEDVRAINETELFKFLTSNEFLEATAKAFDLPNTQRLYERGTPANEFLYDGKNGVWAEESGRFVDGGVGEVRLLVVNPRDEAVWAQTELERSLRNPEITVIDGVPKEVYLEIERYALKNGATPAEALLEVRNAEMAMAYYRVAEITRGEVGGNVVFGTDKFFIGSDVVGTALPDGAVNITSAADSMVINLPLEQLEILQSGGRALEHGASLAVFEGISKSLGLIGVVAVTYDIWLTTKKADAAEASGNHREARELIDELGGRITGGLVGGWIAAELMASALGPLMLTGPVGIAIAGGMTLLAGVIGGLAGSLGLEALIKDLHASFTQAETTRSPLVLDLNGDGIVGTVGQDAGVHFDHDGNGFAELTGWADAADGILVMDRNGNGQIDDGSELFGNHTRLADGTLAANGFAALSDFDSDHDGDVDAQDADFGGLRVWRDLNSNGISEAGELLTLEEAGVQSLSVSYTDGSTTDANGNQHKQEGSYTRSDGSANACTWRQAA